MKMELDELVLGSPHADRSAVGHVDLNGMAVVDDFGRARRIGEDDRLEICFLGSLDVDRRLLFAELAGRVLLIEVSPVRRSGLAAVSPMVGLIGGKEAGGYCQKTHRDRLCSHVLLLFPNDRRKSPTDCMELVDSGVLRPDLSIAPKCDYSGTGPARHDRPQTV